MERTIVRVIIDTFLACIFAAGVFSIWVLRGRQGSFKSEFREVNRSRNGIVFILLLAAVVSAIIYTNNR